MLSLAAHMNIYRQQFTKPITKLLQYITVPLIYFSVLIFLGWIHVAVPNLFSINLAWLSIMGLLVYYYILDIPFGVVMTVIFIILGLLADLISQPAITGIAFVVFLVLLVVGVTLLLISHMIEGKKPALLQVFSQLHVAPMFLIAQVAFKHGYRKELRLKVDYNFDESHPLI